MEAKLAVLRTTHDAQMAAIAAQDVTRRKHDDKMADCALIVFASVIFGTVALLTCLIHIKETHPMGFFPSHRELQPPAVLSLSKLTDLANGDQTIAREYIASVRLAEFKQKVNDTEWNARVDEILLKSPCTRLRDFWGLVVWHMVTGPVFVSWYALKAVVSAIRFVAICACNSAGVCADVQGFPFWL